MPNPSFPVVTLAIWTEQPSYFLTGQMATKSAEMAANGQTDDAPEFDYQTPQIDVRRNWIDTNAANEWIAFVEGLSGPLQSITIQ